jgi:hypothetical protein
MLGGDSYIADRIMADRVEEHRRLAARRRLVRQACSSTGEGTSARWAWLSRLARHLLGRLGHMLSALGRQMEERSLPGSLPRERAAGTRN